MISSSLSVKKPEVLGNSVTSCWSSAGRSSVGILHSDGMDAVSSLLFVAAMSDHALDGLVEDILICCNCDLQFPLWDSSSSSVL